MDEEAAASMALPASSKMAVECSMMLAGAAALSGGGGAGAIEQDLFELSPE